LAASIFPVTAVGQKFETFLKFLVVNSFEIGYFFNR
jgi:hypothetical protein